MTAQQALFKMSSDGSIFERTQKSIQAQVEEFLSSGNELLATHPNQAGLDFWWAADIALTMTESTYSLRQTEQMLVKALEAFNKVDNRCMIKKTEQRLQELRVQIRSSQPPSPFQRVRAIVLARFGLR